MSDSASRNPIRILMMLVAVFLVATLALAAACGGGDDDDDTGGDDEATPTEDAGDDGDEETPTDGGDEETPEATDEGDDGDAGDIFSELDDLTGELDTVTGQITYEVTSDDGTTSTMRFYAKPPNSRFDTTDGTTTSIIITTPDTTYICDSSTESCLSTPGSGDDLGGLGIFGAFLSPEVISTYIAAAEAGGVEVDRSEDSINGIDATCYSWDGDTAEGVDHGRICFNDDGVMVYEEFVDDTGTTKLEATDYSGDVSDSAFDPPYEVTELPGA